MTKKLLVAVDGSQNSQAAVGYAADFGAKMGDIELTLFNVLPPIPPLFKETKEAALRRQLEVWKQAKEGSAREILAQARKLALAAGLPEEAVQVKLQPAVIGVARDILAEAYKGEYDAVVVGRRGMTRIQEFFMGGISNKVVYYADLPVWLVAGKYRPARRMLVALDNSEELPLIIDHLGFMLGGRRDLELTLFYAEPLLAEFGWQKLFKEPPATECLIGEEAAACTYLARARGELLEAGLEPGQVTLKVRRRVISPAKEILAEARGGGYDTLVLGWRGPNQGRGRQFGSVSSKVVYLAQGLTVWVVQ